MRITTKAVFDIASGELLEWEGFDYEGPLELAGGGPSAAQNRASDAQASLTSQLGKTADKQEQFLEAQQNKVNPFYTSRMQNGLPYQAQAMDAQGGTTARAFAPARGDLLRRMGGSSGLPSGFKQQSLTDLDTQQARAYDSNLLGGLAANDQAKQSGAAGLLGQAQIANPTGYYQGALQGNSSIMNANLRKPGIAGLLGGLAGGAASAFA